MLKSTLHPLDTTTSTTYPLNTLKSTTYPINGSLERVWREEPGRRKRGAKLRKKKHKTLKLPPPFYDFAKILYFVFCSCAPGRGKGSAKLKKRKKPSQPFYAVHKVLYLFF